MAKLGSLSASVGAVTTVDSLLGGKLTIEQPAHGYRVNVDALLLARFAAARPARAVTDLGCGVGAVSLVLNALSPLEHVVLVDRDAASVALAKRNAKNARLSATGHVIELGAVTLPRELRASADWVVCNPPFFDARSERPGRAGSARFGSLEPFVAAAAELLRSSRSRAAFAFPAQSLERLLRLGTAHRLVAKRLQLVHPMRDRPARLALVELRRAQDGGLCVEPPIVEWVEPGRRSPELTDLVDGLPVEGSAGDRTESRPPPEH